MFNFDKEQSTAQPSEGKVSSFLQIFPDPESSIIFLDHKHCRITKV